MKLKVSLLFLSFVALLSSCSYRFSDYNIDAKTAKVSFFENQAPIQNANLSQEFTNKLQQQIIRETPLALVQENGEVEFSGAIVGYTITPESVTGTETTAQTRLTITVNVSYENTKDDSKGFQQTFQASDTYDANLDLSSVENELIDGITDQLVQSIFNRAFSNW